MVIVSYNVQVLLTCGNFHSYQTFATCNRKLSLASGNCYLELAFADYTRSSPLYLTIATKNWTSPLTTKKLFLLTVKCNL